MGTARRDGSERTLPLSDAGRDGASLSASRTAGSFNSSGLDIIVEVDRAPVQDAQ
jgi:hypothetical protein